MSESELNTTVVTNHVTTLLKHLRITDYSIDISPGSKKGDNFLGKIASVHVQGKSKNGTSTSLDLIVKSAPDSNTFRVQFPIRIAYEREIYMYSYVLPEFTKLQEEIGLPQPFKQFPKFYNSTMEDLNEALIMENMKVQGFQLWNRFNPVDLNHAMLVMRNYGKLHALSFALKIQKPKLFKEFSANTQERLKAEGSIPEGQVTYIGWQFDKALATLDPVEDKEAYAKLTGTKESMPNRLYTALKSEEAGDHAVIGHGDCWLNNILFKYGDPEKPTVPTELCFLDWQHSRLGSPALDLGYFIFTCTDKELRDQHFDHLIKEYYSTFSAFLRELGSDPDVLLPYEVLRQHIKRFSVYGLFMAVMVLYFISSESDEIPDINDIQDMADAKEKFSYVSKNIEKYRSRIRGVVLDFIKYDLDF